MKMIEITAKEVKEKYPTLKKLFNAINNRELRSDDQIGFDTDYFQDLEELEKVSEKVNGNNTHQAEQEVFYTDFTALPNYGDDGDDEPSEVVWSWSKENFIVGDEVPFSVILREPRTKVAFIERPPKVNIV
jgi:hypothetical protein